MTAVRDERVRDDSAARNSAARNSAAANSPGVGWLHGYTMDSGPWAPLWERLGHRRHVGIDLPGHGRATLDPMPGSLAELASLVAGRLRESGCRELVGLSFGSCVALQVAIDHPDVLDRLVLAAPTLAGPVHDPDARDKYLAMREVHRRAGPGAELAALWMAEPPGIFKGLRRHPAAFQAVAESIERHSFAELTTGSMRALTSSTQSRAQLGALQVPVLVVVGSHDLLRFRANAVALQETVVACTVRVVPGAGHLPLLEEPAYSADALAAFLSQSEARVVG